MNLVEAIKVIKKSGLKVLALMEIKRVLSIDKDNTAYRLAKKWRKKLIKFSKKEVHKIGRYFPSS